MSLDKVNEVDAVGIETDSDRVVLTIVDSWDWNDEMAHLLALQAKLNAYFDFISSGQLLEAYPKALRRRPCIDVIGKHPSPASATAFLDKAKTVASRLGIDISTRQVD